MKNSAVIASLACVVILDNGKISHCEKAVTKSS